MTIARTTRAFTLADQRAFAALSGDHNPIHIDPIEARRMLAGRAVVHGVHLVLFALDSLLADGGAFTSLSSLWVQFERAAGLGEVIQVVWNQENERVVARLEDPEGVIARIHFVPRAEPVTAWAGRFDVPEEECLERELPDPREHPWQCTPCSSCGVGRPFSISCVNVLARYRRLFAGEYAARRHDLSGPALPIRRAECRFRR